MINFDAHIKNTKELITYGRETIDSRDFLDYCNENTIQLSSLCSMEFLIEHFKLGKYSGLSILLRNNIQINESFEYQNQQIILLDAILHYGEEKNTFNFITNNLKNLRQIGVSNNFVPKNANELLLYLLITKINSTNESKISLLKDIDKKYVEEKLLSVEFLKIIPINNFNYILDSISRDNILERTNNGLNILERCIQIKGRFISYLHQMISKFKTEIPLEYLDFLYKLMQAHEVSPAEDFEKFMELNTNRNQKSETLLESHSKELTIFTDAPHGTLGDVFGAFKLITALKAKKHKINWIIRADEIHQSRVITALKNKNLDYSIITRWSALKNNSLPETSVIDSSDAIVVFPSPLYLEEHYTSPNIFRNKPVIVGWEYNFDAKVSNNIEYFFDIRTGIKETNEDRESGIFLEHKETVENYSLEDLHENDREKILAHNTSQDFQDKFEYFFCYLNVDDYNYRTTMANFFHSCIIKSFARNNDKSILLIGRTDDKFLERLKNLLKDNLTIDETNGRHTVTLNGYTKNLKIINPFPLEQKSMLILLNEAKRLNNPVLITGDQSLTEAISIGVPFYYQIMSWKLGLWRSLINFCERKGLKKLNDFLNNSYNKNSEVMNFDSNKYKNLEQNLVSEFSELRIHLDNLYEVLPEKIENIISVIEQHKELKIQNTTQDEHSPKRLRS